MDCQERLINELANDFTDLQWCMQYYYHKKKVFIEKPLIRNATLFGIQRVLNRLNGFTDICYENLFMKNIIESFTKEIINNTINSDWDDVWNFSINELPELVKACIGKEKYDGCMEKAYYGRFNSIYGSDVIRTEIFFKDTVDERDLEEYRKIIYECYQKKKVKCLKNTNEEMYFEIDADEYALCKMYIPLNQIINHYSHIVERLKNVYIYSYEGKSDVLRGYMLKLMESRNK